MNTSQLTFTRFIAAVLIVFYHYNYRIFTTSVDFLEAIKLHFNLGVSYFYVLSGFVMMLAYGKKESINAQEYLINRFARIYPLHIFTLISVIFISIVIKINYLSFYHFSWTTFIEHIFLIQAWFPNNALSLNTVSWSISVEAFFYMCFPLLFNYLFNRINFKKTGLIIFTFWFISQILINHYYLSSNYVDTSADGHSLQHSFLFYNPFFHLNQFLIGLFFGRYFISNYNKLKRNYDFLIILLFLLTCVIVYLLRNIMVHNGMLAINFAILILLISANDGKITAFFKKKALIYFGEISFAMYLLQKPVYDLSGKVFKLLHIEIVGLNSYLYFFLSLIVLIIASHFTYKGIEIPFKNKIKSALSK